MTFFGCVSSLLDARQMIRVPDNWRWTRSMRSERVTCLDTMRLGSEWKRTCCEPLFASIFVENEHFASQSNKKKRIKFEFDETILGLFHGDHSLFCKLW